jgi:hypothetical protein
MHVQRISLHTLAGDDDWRSRKPCRSNVTTNLRFMLRTAMNGNDEVIGLITAMKESLEREIHDLRQHMDEGFADIRARFDV